MSLLMQAGVQDSTGKILIPGRGTNPTLAQTLIADASQNLQTIGHVTPCTADDNTTADGKVVYRFQWQGLTY